MDTEYLRYILLTAQAGSISRAAKDLCLSHQHLSRIVAAFEEEVGVEVFIKGRKGVEPTAQGKLVLKQLEEIVAQIEDLFTRYRAVQFNNISFTEDIYFYVFQTFSQNRFADHINRFYQMYPNARFHLQEMALNEIAFALEKQKLAIGILLAIHGEEAMKQMFSEEMTFLKLGELNLTAIAGKNNLEAKKYKSISLKTLLQKDLVFYTPTGIENNPVYQLLQRYQLLESKSIKYTASNLNMLHQFLNKQQCFTIGFDGKPGKDEFVYIPFQKTVAISYYLAVKKEILAAEPIKTIIAVLQKADQIPIF